MHRAIPALPHLALCPLSHHHGSHELGGVGALPEDAHTPGGFAERISVTPRQGLHQQIFLAGAGIWLPSGRALCGGDAVGRRPVLAARTVRLAREGSPVLDECRYIHYRRVQLERRQSGGSLDHVVDLVAQGHVVVPSRASLLHGN
jgi:hypothetical protein